MTRYGGDRCGHQWRGPNLTQEPWNVWVHCPECDRRSQSDSAASVGAFLGKLDKMIEANTKASD